jgi:molecular chaperone DnaK
MVELKNQSDSLAYQSEKSLNELGDKVDSTQKVRIESIISDLREAIQQEDEDRMRSLSNDLQQAMMQVSQSAYSEQPGGDGNGNGSGGSKTGRDEGVVEGEYTVE